MFLRPTVLNSLMKKTYKSGLHLAMNAEGWLYIAGDYWSVNIKKQFIPKRTWGDIIALTGELPKPGSRFTATKMGNQIEMEMPLQIDDSEFSKQETLVVTDALLIGTQGTVQRLLQDKDTGIIYAVNNVFVNMVDNGQIDEENGEYAVYDPLFHPLRGVLWKNNVCKLKANFRTDDKNIKVLRGLKGIDITPEVPEE